MPNSINIGAAIKPIKHYRQTNRATFEFKKNVRLRKLFTKY